MTAQGNRRLRLSLNNLLFSSHPDPSKCPSEKEHKKYEAESDEFQRNSSGPASFLPLSPKHASHSQALPSALFNLENNKESKQEEKIQQIEDRQKEIYRESSSRKRSIKTEAQCRECQIWHVGVLEELDKLLML